jgi:twitching motility protein PilT
MSIKLPEDSYLNKILLALETKRVSDVHIQNNSKIYYRYLGDIKILDDSQVITNDSLITYLKPALNSNSTTIFKNNMQVDFAFATSNSTRYRANLYSTTRGLSLALRRVEDKIIQFEELGIAPILQKISNLPKGLVIISGQTGSGKSTTINSIIDYINSNHEKHIITIEDPVEFMHKNKKSLVEQREVGDSVKSFNLGVISALREDPDVILIGEMRDSTTIKECLRAAETGHLVFTTLHTQTASKSIDRIVDSCEAGEKDLVRIMLATSLQAIISQKLLKKADNKGMAVAFEVLLGTSAVSNMIRENKISQINSMIQTGSKYGMIDMEASIKKLFESGIITKEEAEESLLSVNSYEK